MRIHYFLLSLLVLPSSSRESSSKNPGLCSLDCSRSRRRPVCGSDGHTYSSRCELDRASCRKRDLRVGYRGECISVGERCFQERRSALQTNNGSGIAVFVPECQANGKYVSVQCHYGTGYCWCVNETGKPVPGSSVRYKKPKCNKKVSRKRSRRGKKGTRKRHAKRICSQSDRMQFNNYVIEKITGEFRSSGQVLESSSYMHSRKSNPKKEMVDWKFRHLDTDSNGFLKRKEFGEFRKDVKRNSRHKQCAITFWKHCDLNDDKKMTLSEWNTCLGVNVNVSFRLFLSLNAKEDPSKEDTGVKEESSRSSKSSISVGPQGGGGNKEDGISSVESKGCDSSQSRTSSIDSEGGFVPECAPNGKYQRVQCFKSTGYCWCADEDTGAPIPGTSRQNAKPDCSKKQVEAGPPPTIAPVGRPWKKCPQPKKKEFQRNVVNIFKILYSRTHQAQSDGLLEEASVLHWQFKVMDRNSDGFLSKKEMRPLRVRIKQDHRLKRCGKRLPVHCDIDLSSTLSLLEWEICFGIKEESSAASSLGSISGKRRGVNPLKKYLRSD